MNYKIVFNVLGKVLLVEAALMFFPMLVGVIYAENNIIDFLIPIVILCLIGIPLSCLKSTDKTIYVREGFVIVALCWIFLSLFGALPFVISGQIPNYFNALFETVSGFTTTGASILDDVSILSKSIMFWRIFTHFIGGMGVLVFILAIFPNDSGAIHLYRAESPGPSSSKLVSKMRYTARILYGIYILLALIEAILLYVGGLDVYESLLNAFSTAGTGGFGIHNGSIAYYNSSYIEIVISIFMFLFGINFNLYYLVLTGNILKIFKSEEFKVYIGIIIIATTAITINILNSVSGLSVALRQSFFQVASISSTTGFSTVDFNAWPALSKSILLILTIIGASGGSTGGGFKVSRVCILIKSCCSDVKKMINPRSVYSVKFEGKPLTQETQNNVKAYFLFWILIVIITTLILSFDNFAGQDMFSHLSATLACIGNVGPGFNAVGPMNSFVGYSAFSKIILCINMLAGRLEIFPMLFLFVPRVWRKN